MKLSIQNKLIDVETDQLEDYTFSRVVYYKLINAGLDTLDSLQNLTEESEHPRAFEVLATYIKNLADTNEKLIDLQMKQQALEEAKNKKDPKLIESSSKQGGLINASTDEILKALEHKPKVIEHDSKSA